MCSMGWPKWPMRARRMSWRAMATSHQPAISASASGSFSSVPRMTSGGRLHMLDMQTDQTALTAAFGCHIVQTEADDLLRFEREVTPADIHSKCRDIRCLFDVPDPGADPVTRRLSDEDLCTAARAAVTLDKFIDYYQLDGLAY